MKLYTKAAQRRAMHQAGFSMVELLVAMLLGLLLMLGATSVMLSTKETYRVNEDVSRIQENGRFALEALVRDIRMAGYRDPGNGDTLDFFLTDACDLFDPCTANGAGTASDRLAVQYDPVADRDCTGSAVDPTDVVVNVYLIVQNAGVNSLACRGWNQTDGAWTAQARALIDGVDSMQVLYGEASAAGSVTRFVSADRVGDWARVQAARIALLVSEGTADGQSDTRERSFVLLDSPMLTFDDAHNRRVYSTTVSLNNAFSTS